MIQIDCDCGKTLKLKEEHAGKQVRCPNCSTVHRVPEPDDALEERGEYRSFTDDTFEQSLVPSKNRTGKSKTAKSSVTGMAKRAFGVLAVALGILIGAGIGYAAFFAGKPLALKAIVVPLVMIAMGISWVKGETFGK